MLNRRSLLRAAIGTRLRFRHIGRGCEMPLRIVLLHQQWVRVSLRSEQDASPAAISSDSTCTLFGVDARHPRLAKLLRPLPPHQSLPRAHTDCDRGLTRVLYSAHPCRSRFPQLAARVETARLLRSCRHATAATARSPCQVLRGRVSAPFIGSQSSPTCSAFTDCRPVTVPSRRSRSRLHLQHSVETRCNLGRTM